MDHQSPYAPPSADLNLPAAPEGNLGEGSLTQALSGQYDFKVFDAISEGFKLSNGHKLNINIGYLIMVLINLPLSLIPFANWLVIGPFTGSVEMMGLRAAVNKKTEIGQIFDGFKLFGPLLGLFLLMFLCISVGFLLLVIPGIYLSIAYLFAIRVKADKGLPVWDAMEASRKAINHRWFSMLGLVMVLSIINMLGFVTLIGWIWTFPATLVTLGVVYRKMFGISNTDFTAKAI